METGACTSTCLLAKYTHTFGLIVLMSWAEVEIESVVFILARHDATCHLQNFMTCFFLLSPIFMCIFFLCTTNLINKPAYACSQLPANHSLRSETCKRSRRNVSLTHSHPPNCIIVPFEVKLFTKLFHCCVLIIVLWTYWIK